jgi:hypothetical protein
MSGTLQKERFESTARDRAGELLQRRRRYLDPDSISDFLDLAVHAGHHRVSGRVAGQSPMRSRLGAI